MSLILIHSPSPAHADMLEAPDDDPGHAPWICLRHRLRAQGDDIATTWRRPGDLDKAAWILFMNIPATLASPVMALITHAVAPLRGRRTETVWRRVRKLSTPPRLGLFLWEPEVVMPENYHEKLHLQFDCVFTWKSDLAARGGLYHPIVWPQPSGLPEPANPAFAERRLLANFSGNKHSPHRLELYSARVEVIRHMEARHPDAFDHYGFGWSADYPSWRGPAASKFDLYPRYRFGLCYENMQSVRGYVTEKIFDCLQAGTVPVYWGAPDITDHVPAEAFVDRRAFTSTAEMIEHLLNMREEQWTALRDAGQRYLRSPGFQRFLPAAFARMVIDGLAATPFPKCQPGTDSKPLS